MKKLLSITSCTALCLLAAASCEKNEFNGDLLPEKKQNIIFAPAMESIGTRAMSEVTQVQNLKVSAIYYKEQTLQTYFENQTTTASGEYQSVGNYYWPDWNLSFYAVYPPVDMTINGGGVTVPVGTSDKKLTGNEDYVCALSESVTKNTLPVKLKFSHILANVAGVKFTTSYAGTGTTVAINELKISFPKYGKYNLVTKNWNSLGTAESTNLPYPETMSGNDTGSAVADISVIPGTYTVSIKYTVSYNGTAVQMNKSASVTLPAGKKSTLVASFKDSDDLKNIQFNVELTPWDTSDLNVSFTPVS